MGRTAHLPTRADPFDLTFRLTVEKWKAVPFPFRALAVAIVAMCLVPAAQAGSRDAFQSQLAGALHAKNVNPSRTGAIVLDLRTGETLFAQNSRLALRPASNEKLATTFTALTALGPSFRIETDVLGDGQRSGATWTGDLVLKGYGDPALSAAQLNKLALQVVADGIEHVGGRILGDESWFDTRRTGIGWKPEFYLHESPALSALIVNRGWTGRNETSKPALMAAELFRSDLRHAGVTIAGGTELGVASAQATPLADVESAPLSALLRHMDIYSDNFYAEMLLKEIGAVQGSGGSSVAGIAVERRVLSAAGVPLSGVSMVDGSGLSVLLRTMWDDPALRPYILPALPIAGETGTLEHRMRSGPAHGLVRAKTGTTANSSALSGFVGDRYAFSILENGYPVRALSAEQSQNRFAQVLAHDAAG
jgi:D-alanyl-D-alanine carboxypeptidase/D-alanyl-D-alanine-endopeptidase (penicillin-binding protein 4)